MERTPGTNEILV